MEREDPKKRPSQLNNPPAPMRRSWSSPARPPGSGGPPRQRSASGVIGWRCSPAAAPVLKVAPGRRGRRRGVARDPDRHGDADAWGRGRRVEAESGRIDVWVNDAMATVFSPADGSAGRMRPRHRGATSASSTARSPPCDGCTPRPGTIVQVGSALAYRAIPLSAVLRRQGRDSRLHRLAPLRAAREGSRIHSRWCRCPASHAPVRLGARHKPHRNRGPSRHLPAGGDGRKRSSARRRATPREVWIGKPAIQAIVGNKLIPGLLDRYLGATRLTSSRWRTTRPSATAGRPVRRPFRDRPRRARPLRRGRAHPRDRPRSEGSCAAVLRPRRSARSPAAFFIGRRSAVSDRPPALPRTRSSQIRRRVPRGA